MAEPRPYTEQDRLAEILTRHGVSMQQGVELIDALTADDWHRGGRCLQLTAEHMQAAEDTADVPRSVEDSKRRLAETLRPLGWAPVAATRRDVAEEIALDLLSRRPHIPPSTDPNQKYAVAMRDTLNRAARWVRELATRPAPTEEPTP